MDVTIKMLTPLWTGGIETGKVDHVHETGILGSLRWWYETIVRGLGGFVVAPGESNDRMSESELCAVSQLFGATGWRRRFRLRVSSQHMLAWKDQSTLNIKPSGRTRGWFLNAGLVGEMTISFLGDTDSLARIAGLLRFLEMWGSLGARPQLGYGAFQISAIQDEPTQFMWEPQHHSGEQPGVFPDLRTFTFFKLRFIPAKADWWREISGLRELRSRREAWGILEQLVAQGMVPVSPAIKNYLRFHQPWSSNQVTHWLFGTLHKDERLRSKMSVSWAYRLGDSDTWEIRGWVYIPQDATGRQARNEIMHALQDNLEQPYTWPQMLGSPTTTFRSAQVICAPALTPWQQHTSQTVADFLNRGVAVHD